MHHHLIIYPFDTDLHHPVSFLCFFSIHPILNSLPCDFNRKVAMSQYYLSIRLYLVSFCSASTGHPKTSLCCFHKLLVSPLPYTLLSFLSYSIPTVSHASVSVYLFSRLFKRTFLSYYTSFFTNATLVPLPKTPLLLPPTHLILYYIIPTAHRTHNY